MAEAEGSIPFVSTKECYSPREIGGCFVTGLMAQRLAQGTHNPWVAGSNPAGPTTLMNGSATAGPFYCRAHPEDSNR